jgi:hypothetical protein
MRSDAATATCPRSRGALSKGSGLRPSIDTNPWAGFVLRSVSSGRCSRARAHPLRKRGAILAPKGFEAALSSNKQVIACYDSREPPTDRLSLQQGVGLRPAPAAITC